MTKSKEARSMRKAASNLRVSPPVKPAKLAAAVSLAVGAMPAFAQWGNQVDVWLRPGTDRSYGGVEGVLPLSQTGTSLLFGDVKFKLGQSGTYEGNLGLGYRFLTGGDWALGFYGGWDYRNSENDNAFHQLSVGAEARSDTLDFRFNYYYPLSDEEYVKPGNNYDFGNFHIYRSGMYEEAMEGFDIEAGILLPVSDKWETRAYAAYYNFESDKTNVDLDGWRVRVETRPMQNLAIGLAYQNDDYFDDQTTLEVRYIFGKDAKPGIRKIRERMTDPWVKDIDIVVTDEEELRGAKYGKAVPNLDVVHINNAYDGSNGTSDGSYERPYTSVSQCETAGGDNGKCQQDSNPADTYGDYNVIRLWEGNSQSGDEYTPITMLNGQMLAGEPITARNIVNLHQQGFWTGTFDPIDYGTMPLIDGTLLGGTGTAVYLASDVSVLGVATVSGGFQGTNVNGYIDIRYNDISNYYTGIGIGIDNTDSNAFINIKYNDVRSSNVGISLRNTAQYGNSYMYASIAGNNIVVNGGGAAGVYLRNESKYSGGGNAAYQSTVLFNNQINVYGTYTATGVDASNQAKYGGNSAYQRNALALNDIDAVGGSSATGVLATNTASKYASAIQSNYLVSNSINASDFGGLDSATGVLLSNSAYKYGFVSQYGTLNYNTIGAYSEYGNATGVAASNSAVQDDSTYYSGISVALQYLDINDNTIFASSGPYASAPTVTGLRLSNYASGRNDGYGVAVQVANGDGNSIYASTFNGDGFGVVASNTAYAINGSGAYAAQYVSLGNNNTISAYSKYGNATGIDVSNRASAYYGSGAEALQSLELGNSNSISADSKYGNATGMDVSNGAFAYYGSEALALQSVTMGDFNSVSATAGQYSYPYGYLGSGNATGISAMNESAAEYYSSAFAGQGISLRDYNSVSAFSSGGSATGISAYNGAAAKYASEAGAGQSIYLGYGNSVSANASWYGTGSATGIALGNFGVAFKYSGTYASQSLNIGTYNDISAFSAYGNATGIGLESGKYSGASNVALAGFGSESYAVQEVTMDDYNDISASTWWYGSGNATGITLGSVAVAVGESGAYAGSYLTADFGNTISAYSGYGNATGVNLLNGAGAKYGSEALAVQGVYFDQNNNIFASTYRYGSGTAIGINMQNVAGAYYSSEAVAFQEMGMTWNNTVSAFSGYGTATGINASNTTYSYYGSSAGAGQTIGLGWYNDVSASTNWWSGGAATGISMANATNTGYSSDGVSVSGLAITGDYNRIDVYSAYGLATGILASNSASAIYGADGYAYQAIGISGSNNVVDAFTWGDSAVGIDLINSSTANYGGDALAEQGLNISGYGNQIDATSVFGSNATGIRASNTANKYFDGDSALSEQQITLSNNTSVYAYAGSGTGHGINATNYAGYWDAAEAVQTITVDNSSVGTYGWSNGAGIRLSQYTSYSYGDASQNLIVTGSTVSGNGFYNGGIVASNIAYTDSGIGQWTQTVAVSNSTINTNSFWDSNGINLFTYGNAAYQVGVIAVNDINAYNGVWMYEGGGALQLVTVSGNSFSNNGVINIGGGSCFGGDCP